MIRMFREVKGFFVVGISVFFAVLALTDNAQSKSLQLEMQREWVLKISSPQIRVLSDRIRIIAVRPPFKDLSLHAYTSVGIPCMLFGTALGWSAG